MLAVAFVDRENYLKFFPILLLFPFYLGQMKNTCDKNLYFKGYFYNKVINKDTMNETSFGAIPHAPYRGISTKNSHNL